MKTNINRRSALKTVAVLGAALTQGLGAAAAAPAPAASAKPAGQNWYKSSSVTSELVRFKNIYGFELVGNLYAPEGLNRSQKHAALVISHPFGAVRQQAALLYAQKLAEAGFVTLAFDQSYWGESGGTPRGSILPDVYTENFSAAVDYVGTLPYVDRLRIGALGICASGGFALAAAKIDTRIRAVATVSMYDMGEYFRTGINGDRAKSLRAADLDKAAASRWQTVDSGEPVYGPGQNDPVFAEAAESNDFSRTSRGLYEPNDRRNTPATYVKFMNFYPLNDLDVISPRPILFIVGADAPSRCYTDEAYKRAAEPKERFVVPGANRTDLYDRAGSIPWEKLSDFFRTNLA